MTSLQGLSPRTRRVLCHALLWALVLAPTLGQIHRVLHGDGRVVHTVAAAQGANEAPAQAWAALFFGHHASDCQMLDALGMADGPPSASLASVHPLPFAQPLVSTPAPIAAQRAAPFQARAPPAWRA